MVGLNKVKLDEWAEETKRQCTGLFRDAQQAHALERLIDRIAQVIDENNRSMPAPTERG